MLLLLLLLLLRSPRPLLLLLLLVMLLLLLLPFLAQEAAPVLGPDSNHGREGFSRGVETPEE